MRLYTYSRDTTAGGGFFDLVSSGSYLHKSISYIGLASSRSEALVKGVEEYVRCVVKTYISKMVVALWDMVGKAANLAQLLGLDAVTLITIAMSSFLRHHEARKECRKLEGRVRMLRVLLLGSVGGRWIMQQQQQNDDEDSELGGGLLQVANALREASDLVESYKRSTLYARVRGARGKATQFRDLRGRVDSYCHFILAVNAFLLVVQPPKNSQQNHPPPSLVIRTEGSHVGVPPSSGQSVHAAERSTTAPSDTVHHAAEPSSTTTPDDTHVIDITPIQLAAARNDY